MPRGHALLARHDAQQLRIARLGNNMRNVAVTEGDKVAAQINCAIPPWVREPNLKMAATAWIFAGASHHTGLSQTLTTAHPRHFAEIAGMKCLVIDRDTKIPDFMNALKWNDAYYHLAGGWH